MLSRDVYIRHVTHIRPRSRATKHGNQTRENRPLSRHALQTSATFPILAHAPPIHPRPIIATLPRIYTF